MNVLTKVLLATDGSERARIAVHLAAAVRWPVGTELEVLEVSEPFMPGSEIPPELFTKLELQLRESIDADLAFTRTRLIGVVPMVQTATRHGRPASEIVREADRIGAELVIVGSRGHGPLATMLLGSVAAGVVDGASCAVLVARVPKLERIVVADDGSAAAAFAVKIVSTWPIFRGLHAGAVSVAPVYAFTGLGPVRHEDATQRYAEGVDALRGIHRYIAEGAAHQLTAAGVPAEPHTRFGDPAQEIIDAAVEQQADLIVMGSRGQSGLERVLVGSVARNVLTHAPVSVLIVHPPRRS